jgi:hypothetical protein
LVVGRDRASKVVRAITAAAMSRLVCTPCTNVTVGQEATEHGDGECAADLAAGVEHSGGDTGLGFGHGVQQNGGRRR